MMKVFLTKWLLCASFFIINFLNCFLCDDIFGCGGFVKSDYDINYSRVEIKLYTKHGSLKYHTDCAPNNGYYLIPVYDKGDYILKIEPPQGWSFEPSSVLLHIDGISDPCSLNQDINFVFKGFTLSGKVFSRYGKSGPAGIKIILKDVHSKVINETVTAEGGSYSFPNLFPGKYFIEAIHDVWLFDESSESITLSENMKTANKIIVAGYDVSGSVFSDGQPIQGVHFLLFSENSKSLPKGCNTEKVKGFNSVIVQSYLCYVTSSNDGKFIFPSLPPGNYKIVPFYKGEHIQFDVSPPEVQFVVEDHSVVIEKSFQIQGFSVSGWIGTRSKGKSLLGVSVYINGEIHGKSDRNGVYHLENMRAGTYKLELKKELMVFDPVEMKISPNTPRLPDIYVTKFSVCGLIQIEEYPSGIEKHDRKISFTSLTEDYKSVVPVNSDGRFCHDVVRGKYYVEPVISDTEASFGLKYIPDKQVIEVTDDPLQGIDFKQFRADVKGKIKCIDKCENLVLDLAPLSHDRPHMKTNVAADGSFEFDKCLPGNYILTVMKDDWCFQSKTLNFIITDKDVLNLELNQIGFQVTITLTHASSFKIKYPSGESHSLELQKNKNVLCLPEKGIYDFIPVGCHLYKKDSFKFDTNNPSEISLFPVKHLVTGNILTEINVTDIKVFVKRPLTENEDVISLQEPLDKKDSFYRYTFSVFAQPNSELHLRAFSKQLLFRPVNATIEVQDDCLENAVEIVGKIGHFLNGSITPPIKGVNIKVFHKENNALFTETVTNASGLYNVGPLEDESNYLVIAKADGYVFTALKKPGEFHAFKLAEILVEVLNDNGLPLAGALLSLSGGTNYRKNSVTQANGKLSFIDLEPGQYFLRPMLKEFSFEPSSKMIDIKEGTQITIKIIGKRVAYSLYGTVTSLTGESEVGIAVEALGVPSGSCSLYQEEAISEQGGAFRIRGLQPNCEYKLHLKPGADVNQHVERSIPKEIPVKVTDGDITGIRLIVFRYYGQIDVSGNIVTSQEYLQTLKVRLYREDAPDQIVHSVTLGQSSFFYLPSLPLDNKIYILQLESSLSTNSYYFEQPIVTFCANTSFYHFTFSFEPRMKSVEQEVTQGSVLALPVAVIALLLAYNYSKLLPLLSHSLYVLSTVINPSKAQNSSENISSEASNVRRKTRPKRVQ